jgi:GAF domain-containing protein
MSKQDSAPEPISADPPTRTDEVDTVRMLPVSNLDAALTADIASVAQIDGIASILEVVCRTTGMGFAAVARVTEDRWIACAVRDEIAFGLLPGGELNIKTTICDEIRANGRAVIIDHVAEDEAYRGHHTPAMYGFQSYISMPILLPNGSMFGTLCAIDPRRAKLNRPEVIGMFKNFAQLIAFHLDA